MAKRYSKLYSTFILRKKYQHTTRGTIWERDWVTIGARHQIERGKRVYFGDTGFLFTDNNIVSTKKKYNLSKTIATNWTYDQVADINDSVNIIKVNKSSNDLRDFAYYGSCSELVRTAIENIILWFPGQITTSASSTQLIFDKISNNILSTTGKTGCPSEDYITNINSGGEETSLYEIKGLELVNPFEINLHYNNVKLDDYANPLRYMSISYDDYRVLFNTVQTEDEDVQTTEHECNVINYKLIPDCYFIETKDEQTVFKTDDLLKECKCNDIVHLCTVKLTVKETPEAATEYVATIECFSIFQETRYFITEISGDFTGLELSSFKIRPKQPIIEEYFDELEGLEKQLLNRDTKPNFQNTFLTPVEVEGNPMYRYVYRDYNWPSNDYCIDINSSEFFTFVDKLSNLAAKLDELWCDNLWRHMTHESIKNYDWTYTRDYMSDQLVDYIVGGRRIEDMLHIYGRVFDDLKRYIDGIKLSAKITYDGFNNMPEAEISDNLEIDGWDIFSTIPVYEKQNEEEGKSDEDNDQEIDYEPANGGISDEFLANTCYVFKPNTDTMSSYFNTWYATVDNNNITPQSTDLEFLRQLQLSTKYIMESKGTVHSLEMVMALFGLGEKDYDIKEYYSVVTDPRLVGTKETVTIDQQTQEIEWSPDAIGMLINSEYYFENSAPPMDPYKGIPMGEIELYDFKENNTPHNNGVYIVPFYDAQKQYDGNFAFQTKGGWGRQNDTKYKDSYIEYLETLSYLRIVMNTEELLRTNPHTVKTGDILYVYSIKDAQVNGFITTEDYPQEGDDDKKPIEYNRPYCHYFYCVDDGDTSKPSSWKMLFDYKRSDTEFPSGGTRAYYAKAQYLDKIVTNAIGNNPHVGYGIYDDGNEFREYMQKPFWFNIERIASDNNDIMSYYTFNILQPITTNTENDTENNSIVDHGVHNHGKIKNLCHTVKWTKVEGNGYEESANWEETQTYQPYWDEEMDENEQPTGFYGELSNVTAPVYYLNDKLLRITNNQVMQTDDSDPTMAAKYFFDVIFPYLSQVIPSSAILLLNNFNDYANTDLGRVDTCVDDTE